MKRNLIIGIAALGMCIGFTSCSKDLTPMSQEEINAAKAQQIVDNYNGAFVTKFGKPATNQNWGFGQVNAAAPGLTRSVGDYASRGHLTATGVTFPEDCDASMFDPDLTNILSYNEYCQTLGNANWTPDEFACGEVYIDETHVGKIHIWGENGKRAKLYIKAGTYDFTNGTFDLCADADLYLLSGATVTLGDNAANTAKFDVYIAPGATLIAKGDNGYRADVDAHVYNHGTIDCSRFEVNGTSFLYNVGTLKSSGNVYIANSTSRIVNDGAVEAGSTNVEGSGAVQNNAEWTIKNGNTVVNCNYGGWVNNGHWTTKNYYYTAGSNNVINNCFLEVTNEFNINMSSATSDNGFRIDTGGGVLTKNFNGGKAGDDANSKSGPYKVIMGHSAVFKVTGTATLDGGNKGWGFFGPADGDYAVFLAENVVRAEGLENNQGAVTYSGNVYVSAKKHFAQGNDGNPNNYFIYEEGGFSVDTNIFADGFRPGKPGVTIQETSCCPGFNGSESNDEFDVRIIGEDLTPGETDWDFNDVVFGVKFNAAGNGATCTLLAAGGTLPLRIAKKGNADLANADEWVEVHALFGVPTTTMVNTGGRSTTVDKRPTFDVTGISKSENGKDIKIYVNKGTEAEPNWIELKAEKGEPAAKLAVTKGFQICTERQNINEIYKRFEDWVENPQIRWY